MKNKKNYQQSNNQKFHEDRIYTSLDYDKFIYKQGNRNVDFKHVANIAEDMTKKGWCGAPIEVSVAPNGKLQIEEGQHRYEAAKLTNTPMRYMVVPAKTVFDVATANSLSSKWSMKNYVEAYSGEKNTSYQRLSNLQNEFPMFSLGEIMTVATGYGGRKSDTFKKGYYRMDDKAFREARINLLKMVDIKNALKDADRASKAYFTVISTLLRHEKIESERTLEKIEKYAQSLLPVCSTTSAAVDHFERLYNHYSKGDKVYLVDAYKKITRNEKNKGD